MKNTPSLLYHIYRVSKEACKIMNIKTPKGFITNDNDFNALSNNEYSLTDYKTITKKRKTDILKGCYSHKTDYVYLNLKEHSSISELDQTIIHELTHKKFPNLRHCKKFHKYVEKISLEIIRCDHYFFKARCLINVGTKKARWIESNYCKKCMLEIKHQDIKIHETIKGLIN